MITETYLMSILIPYIAPYRKNVQVYFWKNCDVLLKPDAIKRGGSTNTLTVNLCSLLPFHLTPLYSLLLPRVAILAICTI